MRLADHKKTQRYGAFVDGIAGAFVEGIAGAFVDGISGVAAVSDLLQPASSPAQTRPNTAIKGNSFFIHRPLRQNSGAAQAQTSDFSARNQSRQLARLPDEFPILRQIAKTEIWQAALLAAQQFARPAQFQIRLRDFETVICFF